MSMELLTVIQTLIIAVLYLGVVVLIPAIVFHGCFEEKPFATRFMAYLTIGNFYVMNLVFLLQLLHISNRVTLILGVVIPALAAVGLMNWKRWVRAALESAGETTRSVLVQTMGYRLFFSRMLQGSGRAVLSLLKKFMESLFTQWYDWGGTLFVLALIFWQYGTNLVTNFGYNASDLPVHNYWINAMCRGEIFVAGVYPFGFHCLLYFFHEVFGVEVYVLLRVFFLVQTTLIYMTFLMFLRAFTRIRVAPYAAAGVYLILDIWDQNAFTRFFSSLPQEYGMLFLLPSIYFLIRFLQDREDENGEKGFKLDSTVSLLLFAMNFSMTLAVHFYDTMSAGLFCVAVAAGFLTRVFRKEYFWRILSFGILSIVVAVLPMGIAYVLGTPLEGSLRWGMSIMQSGRTASTVTTVPQTDAPSREPVKTDKDAQDAGKPMGAVEISDIQDDSDSETVGKTQTMDSGETLERELTEMQQELQDAESGKKYDGLKGKIHKSIQIFMEELGNYVFANNRTLYSVITVFFLALSIVCCVLCFLLGDRERGSLLTAATVNVLFLGVVLISSRIGLPAIMDHFRCSMYMAFSLMILLGLVLDFALYLLFGLVDSQFYQQVLPTLICAVLLLAAAKGGLIRQPFLKEPLETNGAIKCVTNILRENPSNTFTIISANDEYRMVEEDGYFYEDIVLLRNCLPENEGNYLTIPTKKVYLFVEKMPIDYGDREKVDISMSGQSVSLSNAMRELPMSGGISVYSGVNRHIVMSKLYFWARAFSKMYNNEMRVYYEDEEFVCYEITQNINRLFDFSIDYGY